MAVFPYADLSACNASLTLEQLQETFLELQKTADELDEKLALARNGARQVSARDVQVVETRFGKLLNLWTQRRRMFLNIWDAVSENIDGKQSDIFEDIGVDTDEAVGEVLSKYNRLLSKSKKAKT